MIERDEHDNQGEASDADRVQASPVERSAGEPRIEHGAGSSPEDDRVAELLELTIDVPALAIAVEQQEAADAADTLEHLEDEDAAEVLVAMEENAAAEALAEMEVRLAAGVIEDLLDENEEAYAGLMIRLMAPDDAADILQSLDEELRERLFKGMPRDVVLGLRKLVGYDEDTAAGLMTTDFLVLRESMTVAEATETIRNGSVPEHMQDLPVMDDRDHLVGIVGLRALLLNRPSRPLSDIVDRAVKAIHPDLDQEAVAHEFDRYDFFMLPVVDENHRLLGIVTVDDVIDIIRVEQTEDVQKTVGAGAGEAVYSGISEKFRGRFPWLVISLLLTCGAAAVVLFFEEIIRAYPIVAFLMPVIAALVGNAGHQALAVTLRGIVLDEVRPGRVLPLVTREAGAGILNGCALGVLIFLVVTGISGFTPSASWQLGAIAGVALAISMCAGAVAGSGIPLLMRRLGADPAQSSAIFLIMVTDALAFSTFLSLTYLAFVAFDPG